MAACGGGGSSDPGSHSVSVTVTGLRHSYNGMTLRNNGGDDLKVFGDGAASFKTALAGGSAYSVTVSSQPTGPDQTCTVANGSGTIGGSDVTNVTIDCPYPAAYAVGGTVTGLLGTGLKLQYYADNVSLLSVDQVDANGAFGFDASRTSAVNGTVYAVSIINEPTNPAQTCAVLTRQRHGRRRRRHAASTWSATTHTVSVTITGLRQHSAHGIKLRNNGDDDRSALHRRQLRVRHARWPPGSAYSVTIAAQPQTPDQTCTVSNGSGTMGSSDVTNVVVDCPYPPARSVGGTITGMTGTGLDLTYFAPNLGVQLGTAAITGNGFVVRGRATPARSAARATASACASSRPTRPATSPVPARSPGRRSSAARSAPPT